MSATCDFAPLRQALAREYTIDRVIEESADGGAVYIAVDRILSRPVLIRAVDPGLSGETRTEAFRREARILASLSHPGIPSVHHGRPCNHTSASALGSFSIS